MPPAATLPVASVYVDNGLPHLDRTFDYLISEGDSEDAQVGTKVRVRFSGKLTDAYVVARRARSDHEGKLAFIERVVSAEVVLRDDVAALARAVADRAAGTFNDVVRLAVPPRHAATEKTAVSEAPSYVAPDPAVWGGYELGPGYLNAVAQGKSPRAVWNAVAGEDWCGFYAQAAATAAANGRGAIIVVPDERDLTRLAAAMRAQVGKDGFATLSSAAGPSARYRQFLRCSRGTVRIAIGTRSAIFAPVHDLGLIAMWDDGDDLYQEPRAPYFHVRDVALLRAHLGGTALLLGGYGQSVAAAALLEQSWASPLRASRARLREATPRIMAAGDDLYLDRDAATHSARLPSIAIQTARTAIENDQPVLIQVPRRGYVPALACERCRTPARCNTCAGPLGQPHSGASYAACRWCGRAATQWSCPVCRSGTFRALIFGSGRTAEEFGRIVPGTRVVQSAGDHIVDQIDPGPALVIATPGAEPHAPGGYAAALLLDGWAFLSRPDLTATEEAMRRWINAAALVKPAAEGGRVVVMAAAAVPVVQALVRWSPGWLADRELAERRELGFPPAVRMAAVTGTPSAVGAVTGSDELPPEAETLGPVEVPGRPELERALLRVPLRQGGALASALAHARSARSARKASDKLQIQMDPPDLL
ncbi:replication restart DNA helicase PriA [Antricoccus suffuscus]|uniref:Probable replication restart protein PriA n=1 Tax=Antricoccus suffuscus TaxID=1629062 RepID=A0A2T0ZWM5_9ACTN|nr:primosomal protein N' [Antricoccus suffuscus]PRZ40657.1 replication restart DNA helicase PriA [Antricoccus suffuscus]